MRKKIYFLAPFVFCISMAFGQAPKISVDSTSFKLSLNTDSSKTLTFTIRNNGTHDLTWKLSRDSVTFTKLDGTDITLAENQDRVANDVWITRNNSQGLFNIEREAYFQHYYSPVGTAWAYGPTRLASKADYDDWNTIVRGNMSLNDTFSMHLINSDQYFDVKYNSWTQNANGGGFSYTRFETFPWIQNSLQSGRILPGESEVVSFQVITRELNSGTYTGYILIASNDLTNAKLKIPITIKVAGTSDFSVSTTSLDYGSKPITGNYKLLIPITNTGTGPLSLSPITTKTAFYSAGVTSLNIAAGNTSTLTVSFMPTTLTEYFDTLKIATNVHDYVIAIPLHGFGTDKPKISVDSASLSVTLNSGSSVTKTINISNSGNHVLNWAIKLKTDSVHFVKTNYADYTLAENQDRITPSLYITRARAWGIFNLVTELAYNYNSSPGGTLWAQGYSDQLDPSVYTDWRSAISGNPPESVGVPYSMYIQDYDLYIDIMFTRWAGNNTGGEFAYKREGALYWIGPSVKTGTTDLAGSTSVDLTFNASKMLTGIYKGDVIIRSNDPEMQEFAIPTTLKVVGVPAISTSGNIDFGTVYSNSTTTGILNVSNTGTDTLKLLSIDNADTTFKVEPFIKNIAPGKDMSISISCKPALDGTFVDTLVIISNDPDISEVLVPLQATAILPPVLEVKQAAIFVELNAGTQNIIELTINNTGDNNLTGIVTSAISDVVSFEKSSYENSALPANQDHITDSVWIARVDRGGLFNARTENSYNWGVSPAGTTWAFEPTMVSVPGDYTTWRDAVYPPPSMVGNIISMHAVEEDRYFDFLFSKWAESNSGGGFAYTRYETPTWIKAVTGNTFNVAASDSAIQQYFIDASTLNAGTFKANLVVFSNDSINNKLLIPVTMKVNGTPTIFVADPPAFGSVPINLTSSENITVFNEGTDTLKISNISNKNSAFVLAKKQLNIAPGTNTTIKLSFTPVAEQEYLDTLTFISNDTSFSNFLVPISGTGVQPPNMLVNLSSVDTVLYTSQSATYKLVIQNTGTTVLRYNIGGKSTSFTKANNADYTLPANQDRITSDVWITRKSSQSIYNAALESGYGNGSPKGTLWGLGLTADLGLPDYQPFITTLNSNPQSAVGQNMSLYLMNDKKFYDVLFSSFSGGNTGGGFSYIRSEILPDWLTFDKITDTISSGKSDTVEFTLSAGDLSGKFSANFAVFSNDPDMTQWPVQVSFTSGGIVVNSILSDMVKNVGFGSDTIDFSNDFSSAVFDTISYTCYSSDTAIVKVTNVGTELIVKEKGVGTANITIRAESKSGSVVYDDFSFRVNESPVLTDSIADIIINEGFGSKTYDLSAVFADPDDEPLSYLANSSATNVVTTAVVGNTLTISETGIGSSTITVSASDSIAPAISDQFNVVVNAIPLVSNAITDTTVNVGAQIVINLSGVFSDADGDNLMLTTSGSNNTVTDLSISGESLTITGKSAGLSTITVKADDQKGGSDSTSFTCTVVNPVGLSLLSDIASEVYPIPTAGLLNIQFEGLQLSEVKLKVYNSIGYEMMNNLVSITREPLQVDLSSFADGIYTIKLEDQNRVLLIKQVVVKK